MDSNSESQDLFQPSFSPRGISLAGLMLTVLFLAIFAGTFFPLALFDPSWQLRVTNTLLNSSPVSLSGLVLIHLGSTLDRQDRHLQSRRELASRLAVVPCIGFLLLVPLLTSAILLQDSTTHARRSAVNGRVSMQLERMQNAVNQATSVEDLEQRLRALNGPVLEQSDRGLPLPQVKLRVQAVLNLASKEIATNMPAYERKGLFTLLPEILRLGLASLALSIAFGGLARRRGSDYSFLLEALGGGKRRLSRSA